MILGIFSDAHGNEEGFFKCFDHLAANADSLYFLGDAVGYFPLSNKIIDTLRKNKVTCLKGNHDAMVLGELEYVYSNEEVYLVEESKRKISSDNLSFLKDLPSSLSARVDNRNLLFVHGSPANPLSGYIYPDTDISSFASLEYDAIFMGHTHRSFIKKNGNQWAVNAGSCGLPRDIGNRLTTLLYDTETNEVTLQDLELDVKETLEKYKDHIHPSVKEVLNRNNKIYDRQ
jgi:putative phosphoesterase